MLQVLKGSLLRKQFDALPDDDVIGKKDKAHELIRVAKDVSKRLYVGVYDSTEFETGDLPGQSPDPDKGEPMDEDEESSSEEGSKEDAAEEKDPPQGHSPTEGQP